MIKKFLYLQLLCMVLSAKTLFAVPSCVIISPVNNAGSSYNNTPFLLIRGTSDDATFINDIAVQIASNSTFQTLVYVSTSVVSYRDYFSLLGTGVTIDSRHRVQTSITDGTRYIRAKVAKAANMLEPLRWSNWSATIQIAIAADFAWTQSGAGTYVSAGTTQIRYLDFNELDSAIDQLRSFRGSGAGSYPGVAAGDQMTIGHMTSLRNDLQTPFNNDTPASGSNIKAVHINEMRDRILLP